MILFVDEMYHDARFNDLHPLGYCYNMTEMRRLSSSSRTTMLFIDRARHFTRTIVHTFLPTYRLISTRDCLIYPKYYSNSQLFQKKGEYHLDELNISDFTKIQFYYSLNFRRDKDTPHDPKIPIKTFLIEDQQNKKDISNDLMTQQIRNPFNPFDEENSLVVGSKDTYWYSTKDFAMSLVENLSEYYDIKASLKILQTEFRVSDILDNCEEDFIFKIFEKLIENGDIQKEKIRVKKGKIGFDFSHEIEENNIQKAIQKLIGWKIPEDTDRDFEEFEPLKFELLNDRFYFIPLKTNPLRGFIVPKKFYKNRAMFTGTVLLDVDILIYDPVTLQEIEEFCRYPTEYSDMDILAQIPRILDILAIKYKGAARATITVSIGNKYDKSIIIEDSVYTDRYRIQQEPLERVYEMIFTK